MTLSPKNLVLKELLSISDILNCSSPIICFFIGRVWFIDTSRQKSARGEFQQKNNFKHIQLTIYERKSNRKLRRDSQGIKFGTKSNLMWKCLHRELWPLVVYWQKELYLWRLIECPLFYLFLLLDVAMSTTQKETKTTDKPSSVRSIKSY